MMKTVVEDVSSVKKRLIVEIEAAEVDKRVNDAYKKVGKVAKIKGFRPGKIPRKILERYYGDQVLEDVTGSLIKETLPGAMEETNTFPLHMPVIENEILKGGENYKYAATMEVRPEFEIKDYLGIAVEKEKCLVIEDDIDKQLEDIRKASGNLMPVEEDRGIKKDDYAIIDYEAFEGNKAIDDVKAENYTVNIGSDSFYPGFEDALIGYKKGDKPEITIDFKDDYFHSKLAGKKVDFKVEIKDIKQAELPELNDEFIKNLGGEFSTLEELRNKVKEDLIEKETKRIENDLRKRLLDRITDSLDFELPESLVEAEVNMTIENIKQNLIRAGSSIEKSGLDEIRLKEEVRPSAEKAVKNMLVLGEIASLNEIKIEEDDLSKGFEDMTKGTGYDTNEIRRYYEANNLIDTYRQTLLKEKTLNFLVENATVTEVDSIKKEDDE